MTLSNLALPDGFPDDVYLPPQYRVTSVMDMGGMRLTYSPTDHSGLDFADLSIIDASGKFRR